MQIELEIKDLVKTAVEEKSKKRCCRIFFEEKWQDVT